MPTINIRIDREEVWEEVAKTAAYTGDKLGDADEGAYSRIMLTDEDRESLERFWEEVAATADDRLRDVIESPRSTRGDYDVDVRTSVNYDPTLNLGVKGALTAYFTAAVTARWFKLCNKDEAADYMAYAEAMMQEARRMLYSRRAPQRPERKYLDT